MPPSTAYLAGHFSTVGDLCNRVGMELNLGNVADATTSQDPLWQQLLRISVDTGQDLIRQVNWSLFQTTSNLTTPALPPAPSTPPPFFPMDLPADFLRLTNQTNWNYTTQLPFAGPISPQIRAWLVGRIGNSVTLFLGFAMEQGQLLIWPNPPPANQSIFFDYTSKNWVQRAGTNATASRYTPGFNDAGGGQTAFPWYSASSDLILFDPQLFSRALKLRFLTEKGFDTTQAQSDFDSCWDSVVGSDAPMAKLSLNGSGTGFRYLDGTWNVPVTGYGS